MTISFDEEGISGDAGCTSYEALAKVDDDSFTIEVQSLFHTEKECLGLDDLMEQEKRYLGVLPRLTRHGLYGDNLYMHTDDDVYLLFHAK